MCRYYVWEENEEEMCRVDDKQLFESNVEVD